MVDRDITDMFLNFQLHVMIIPYTGIGMILVFGQDEDFFATTATGSKGQHMDIRRNMGTR